MNLLQINKYLKSSEEVTDKINYETLIRISELIRNKYINKSNSIFTCGNGGSAHCAGHFVTDFAKMLKTKKSDNIRIYSLVDNIGMITAYANDICYNKVFSQQLDTYGKKGDALFVITGSGKSKNIIEAASCAKSNGITLISFTGFDGGAIKGISDYNFHVPSNNMQIVEDIHVQAMHILMLDLVQSL